MAQARVCPACRKTRLSRYNPDPLCAPCTRAARTTPALAERGAPTWLWDSPPMRDALARVDLAAAVAVFRADSRAVPAQTGGHYRLVAKQFKLVRTRSPRHALRRPGIAAVRRHGGHATRSAAAAVLGTASAALPDAWLAEMSVAADGMLEETGVDIDRRGFRQARRRRLSGRRAFPKSRRPPG